MKNIIDRLEEYMIIKGLNDNKITETCGFSTGQIGKSRKSRKGMHSDSIEKILYCYPDLNPDWFLTGRGSMFVVGDNKDSDKNIIIEHLKDEIKLKDNEIKELNRELGKKELLIEQLKNNQRISYGNLTPSIK